jgi:lysophospholipase L1-like esterase
LTKIDVAVEADKKTWLYTGLALVAGVGLVSMLSAPSTAEAASKSGVAAPKRMLLVGDSLAVGLGAPLKKLAADKGIGVAYDGKVGTTSSAWASGPSLPADLQKDKFDVVLVSLGTNDMPTGWGAEQVASYMATIVGKIQQSGARAVWIAPPRMRTLREDAVRQAIASLGVPVFPSDALDIPRGGDSIHPTATGYAGWAGAILSWLAP